jgi:hypothetical protein
VRVNQNLDVKKFLIFSTLNDHYLDHGELKKYYFIYLFLKINQSNEEVEEI